MKKLISILCVLFIISFSISCASGNNGEKNDINTKSIEENNEVTLYKVGDNNTTIIINSNEIGGYTSNYEWSIEPTTLMYRVDGSSSWIWNSEIDRYKEKGWTLTPPAIFTYNVFQKSNLSVEQLNKILSGTGLAGYGQAFYDMEQTYNVNSLFCIAVGSHESGNFYAKANTNNFFGFRGSRGWMSFSSPQDCINYFGELMNTKTYYGKSIEQIALIYCNSSWADYIKRHMHEKWLKLNDI